MIALLVSVLLCYGYLGFVYALLTRDELDTAQLMDVAFGRPWPRWWYAALFVAIGILWPLVLLAHVTNERRRALRRAASRPTPTPSLHG